MTHTIHAVTINNLKDLESCCQRWRELGAKDDTTVVIEGNFCLDVTGHLKEHHTSGKFSISFEYYEA
jgi:hypothetical protein